MTVAGTAKAKVAARQVSEDWNSLADLPDELSVSYECEGESICVELRGGHAYIGRLQSLRLQVKLSGVSEKHAKLRWESTSRCWNVEDLGSTNGTKLNGKALKAGTAASLKDGDEVVLGGVLQLVVQVKPLSSKSTLRELLYAKGKCKSDERRAEAEDSIVEIRSNWDRQKQAYCDAFHLHEDHPARD